MIKLTLILTILCVSKSLSKIRKLTIENPLVYKEKIKQLIQHLDTDFTEYWIYKDLYNHPKEIGVTPKLLQKSISNLGDETRLKNILLTALHGKKVELTVVGGSISRGAPWVENGKGHRVFSNAIRHWWNKVFAPVTSSRMYLRSVALGGVGTDYYSYCLATHLPKDMQTKIILWELSANDYGRYDDKPFPPGQPLEQFTRNVLQRKSKPALIYINFFRGHDYNNGKCKNYEDEGEMTVAKHYRITSISWRNFVCDNMKHKAPLFTEKNLFSADHLHPSILGHSQMAFLLINHLKKQFFTNTYKSCNIRTLFGSLSKRDTTAT